MPALMPSGPMPGWGLVLHSRSRLGLAVFTRPGVRPVPAVGQPSGLGAVTTFPGLCDSRGRMLLPGRAAQVAPPKVRKTGLTCQRSQPCPP